MLRSIPVLVALLLFASRPAVTQQFSFAVFADVQYGDQPTAGKRDYRRSLPKLEEAVKTLNARGGLEFAVQLGDLIDSRGTDLDPILAVYNRLETRRYHVLGNHDFSMERAALVTRLGTSANYEFSVQGWRFVALDGMDVSAQTNARADNQPGKNMLESLLRLKAPNAFNWNGAVGDAQLAWLSGVLERAGRAGERVILMCHFPVLKESSTPAHLLWNHEAVRRVVEAAPAVVAWFNGHDHAGGYAASAGIHYVTLPGMVESGERNSYTVVSVYPDRLVLAGQGSAPKRELPIVRR